VFDIKAAMLLLEAWIFAEARFYYALFLDVHFEEI